jgi:hypothetical protein
MRPEDEAAWRRLRSRAWSDGHRAPEWPPGVHALSREGLRLLGLDDKGRLYWDGRQVGVGRRPDPGWRQRLAAAAVTAALLSGGVNGMVQAISAATEYGCRHGWWTNGCVPHLKPAGTADGSAP